MDDFFRIAACRLPSYAQCLIAIDEYVPLRFSISDGPLGSRFLRLGDYRETLVAPMAHMIDDCLATSATIHRRTVTMPGDRSVTHLGVTVSPLFDGNADLGLRLTRILSYVDCDKIPRVADSVIGKQPQHRVEITTLLLGCGAATMIFSSLSILTVLWKKTRLNT